MYQRLVAVLFIGALGMTAYYVHNSNIEEIVSYAAYGDQVSATTQDEVAGNYICTPSTGCDVLYRLSLRLTGTAKLVPLATTSLYISDSLTDVPVDNSYDDDPSLSDDYVSPTSQHGTWRVLPGGIVQIEYVDVNTHATSAYRTLLAQDVTTAFITKFTFNKKAYPSLKKPRFVREELVRHE
jgi:hypothetical protein